VLHALEMLMELSRREKEAGIKPDPEIDMFMKVRDQNAIKFYFALLHGTHTHTYLA
jgi:hypothetical protein